MTLALWASLFLAVYVAATAALSWAGARRTTGFAAFATGSNELGSLATALVAAACLTSTATFSINPGFVYKEGLAALLGFSLPLALGVTLAFLAIGPRLRETSLGPDGKVRVLTLPEWIGARFESRGLRAGFAILTLALFTYAVLVLTGASYVAAETFGVRMGVAAAAIMTFVVALTAIGGTNAHASTNVVKALLLLCAAATTGGTAAARLFFGADPLAPRLAAEDPALFAPFRDGSALFGGPASVLLFPFVMGFALACQPHIVAKVLYVKDARAVRRTGLLAGALFLVLAAPALLVGLAARGDLGAGVAQDRAASLWIARAFPAPVAAALGVVMIAAAIGTLNALLLALGTTLAHDVVRPLVAWFKGAPRSAGSDRSALVAGRVATVVTGALVAAVAYDPPRLVWVVGVAGVYALVAAACPAVIFGCLARRPRARWVAVAAVAGPLVHATLYGTGAVANPNATGAAGVAAGIAILGVGTIVARLGAPLPGTVAAVRSRSERLVRVG